MLDLIGRIARALVDRPDEVTIRMAAGEASTVFELRVGEGELGKIIGKHGQTIRAIRTILSGAGTKLGRRAVLQILE